MNKKEENIHERTSKKAIKNESKEKRIQKENERGTGGG